MKKFFATLTLAVALLGFGATAAVADDILVAEETSEMVQTLTYTAPVLDCETWQLPGWLDEQGNPTGCVDNAPCPEAREGLPCPADIPVVEPVAPVVTPVEAPVTPVEPAVVEQVTPVETAVVAPVAPANEVTPVVETVPMLAETGSNASTLLQIVMVLVGSGLLLTGAAFTTKRATTSRKEY